MVGDARLATSSWLKKNKDTSHTITKKKTSSLS